jgi:hypothetical protein
VRLVVDYSTIQERCATDPTSARANDLRWTRRWIEGDTGVGVEDLIVTNDRPVREVATDIVGQLGW